VNKSNLNRHIKNIHGKYLLLFTYYYCIFNLLLIFFYLNLCIGIVKQPRLNAVPQISPLPQHCTVQIASHIDLANVQAEPLSTTTNDLASDDDEICITALEQFENQEPSIDDKICMMALDEIENQELADTMTG